MFNAIKLPKIKFKQAVNPFLVHNSNNYASRQTISLPSAQTKLNNIQRKFLTETPKLKRTQLPADEVNINPAVKEKRSSHRSRLNGKSIKNALEQYFDNTPKTSFEKAKEENLKQLVNEYEKETPSTFFKDRVKAMYAMKKRALAQIQRGLDLKAILEKDIEFSSISALGWTEPGYKYLLIKDIDKFA